MPHEPTRHDLHELRSLHEAARASCDRIQWQGMELVYPPEIDRFMLHINASVWNDPRYDPKATGDLLRRIPELDLAEIRSLLTAIARSERFSTGAWQVALERMPIDAILDRAGQLLDAGASSHPGAPQCSQLKPPLPSGEGWGEGAGEASQSNLAGKFRCCAWLVPSSGASRHLLPVGEGKSWRCGKSLSCEHCGAPRPPVTRQARVFFFIPLLAIALFLIATLPERDSAALPTATEIPVSQLLPEKAACLARFDLDAQTSVLAEHREHADVRDFPTRIASGPIDPDTQRPVARVARYQAGGTPLLWYRADFSELVVNAAALSDLDVVDVTSLPAGEARRIGQRNELVLGLLSDRDLVAFLLEARVIATWVHLGASLCLVAEDASGDAYTARFSGSHTYMTGQENTEALAFSVSIDEDGWIFVRGEAR